MAHVLAGPQFGTVLAEQGADVLNVWAPKNYEPLRTYCYANTGLRSTTLDGTTPHGRAALQTLLRDADVFFANRRPAKIASPGLDAEGCAALRPGIVHVSFSCFGERGPWADWAGFDPHAQAVTGIAALEGSLDEPKMPPTHIYNDLVSAWLAAAGAMAALRRRSVEGGSWRVRISLARCSVWLRSFGLVERAPGDLPPLPEPDLREADTPLGRYRYIPSQLDMSATPPWFEHPLTVKGAAPPRWLG
jgi:crotonobetainyl-CoA:carnitine CoA-transferase CaiB-like acyl-CoA transferase